MTMAAQFRACYCTAPSTGPAARTVAPMGAAATQSEAVRRVIA